MIPPALAPLLKIALAATVVRAEALAPLAIDTRPVIAAAIPEMLKPPATLVVRLKPMVWLASAPTWKVPLYLPSSNLVPAKVVSLEMRLISEPSESTSFCSAARSSVELEPLADC
ncbi:hypothetical protein D3C87_1332260 [compost metagenome]